MTFTWTTSGKLEFEDISADDINLEDIATALSRTVRFNGHGKFGWSVAQHSCLVADVMKWNLVRYTNLKPTSPECRAQELLALLHDAGEAYVGDITRPVRELLGTDQGVSLKRIETFVMHRVVRKLDLSFRCIDSPDVRQADNVVLAIEVGVLFPHADWKQRNLELGGTADVRREFAGRIVPFNPPVDAKVWTKRLHKLVSKLRNKPTPAMKTGVNKKEKTWV